MKTANPTPPFQNQLIVPRRAKRVGKFPRKTYHISIYLSVLLSRLINSSGKDEKDLYEGKKRERKKVG